MGGNGGGGPCGKFDRGIFFLKQATANRGAPKWWVWGTPYVQDFPISTYYTWALGRDPVRWDTKKAKIFKEGTWRLGICCFGVWKCLVYGGDVGSFGLPVVPHQ